MEPKGMTYTEYLETLPQAERDLRAALNSISQQMRGSGFDMLKPISADFANQIANVLYNLAWGDSYEQAVKSAREAA